MTTTLISAWLPVRDERIQIDPSRLSYKPGYPSHLGPEHDRLQLSVWIGGVVEAHLEAAIVSDSVEHEKLRAHWSIYVWRLVRDRDSKVLYDSLDAHESWRTAYGSNSPLDWSSVIRRLRNAGELSQARYRSLLGWP